MRIARSARTKRVLGATLIALTLPAISFAAANSSGVNGIDGSSMNGIGGSSILGIDGSSINGIDGSSVLGIDGSSNAGIDGSSTTGIDGSSVLLAGPVDGIDRINGVFESMGQIVMASQDMLSGMQVGDYITVEGSLISSGWYYADAVEVSDRLYVAGSTEVFVAGLISSVNAANGTAQIGDLTIDYTASLGGSDAPSDALWSFHGTRPSQSGNMISYRTAGADLR